MKIAVRAVAFYDCGVWIAQGLEHDIAVSAQSPAKLRRMFEKAIVSNVCVNTELGRDGLDGIPPAPERFWTMFEQADSVIEAVDKTANALPVHIAAMRLAELGIDM